MPKKFDLQYFICKYGSELGAEKFKEYQEKMKTRFTLAGFISRYGEKLGNEKFNEFRKKLSISRTLEGYIQKYGEVDGKVKWENKQKTRFKPTLDNFIIKYGEEEGTKRYNKWLIDKSVRNLSEDKYNNWKNNVANTLDNFKIRYGEEEGTKRYNKMRDKESNKGSLQWYIENYGHAGIDKYLNKCSITKNAMTKKNFILKYGEIEGCVRWEKYCDLNRYTNTLEYYIERYGDISGYDKYMEWKLKAISNFKRVSKSSIEFFTKLILALNLDTNDIRFNDNEFFIYDKNENKIYFYDFLLESEKIIIEFNGCIFHYNTEETQKNEKFNMFKLIDKDISIDRDNRKRKLALDSGYKIFTVWDNDPDNLDKAINFIKLNKKQLMK